MTYWSKNLARTMRSGSSRSMNREAVTGRKIGENTWRTIPIKLSNVSWNEEKPYPFHEFILYYFHHNYFSICAHIRTINFSDPLNKARHDRMVALVTQMLDLNKKLLEVRLEQERTMLSRQIEATDAAIDKLVYELYGLTEEGIRMVEGSLN